MRIWEQIMNRFDQVKSSSVYVAVLLLSSTLLSSCLTGYLEEDLKKQQEQLKEQSAEMARQRAELEALRQGKQTSDQCNRAFRDYFDRAQLSANRDERISLYRQGLQLCPEDDVAHYELGRTLVDSGRRGEAELEFEAALKFNPGFAEARRQLEILRGNR
jgi:tetratricopeptide (TPR) repeat protein